MSEQSPAPDAQGMSPETPPVPAAPSEDPAPAIQEPAAPDRTGDEEVDAVVDSVADLDRTPVEEHVAVFESAHDRLRRALDGRTDG